MLAGHAECVLVFGKPASRAEIAQDLYDHALLLLGPDEYTDGDVARWVQRSVGELKASAITDHDANALLLLAERLTEPNFPAIALPERSSTALDLYTRAADELAVEPMYARSPQEFAQVRDQIQAGSLRALRTDRPLDPGELQNLLELTTRWGLADRSAVISRVAEIEQYRAPEAPLNRQTEAVSWAPVWPGPLAMVTADLATYANFMRNSVGQWDGDTRGDVFVNRWWALKAEAGLVRDLGVRASLPGALGEDATRPYVAGLAYLALSHAAAGSPATATVLVHQIEATQPGALDLPLPGTSQTARQALAAASPKAVARPILLLVPRELAGQVRIARAEAAPSLGPSSRLTSENAWFLPETTNGTWVVGYAPFAEDVHLEVSAQDVPLPAGDEAVIARLKFVASAWRLEANPLPTTP